MCRMAMRGRGRGGCSVASVVGSRLEAVQFRWRFPSSGPQRYNPEHRQSPPFSLPCVFPVSRAWLCLRMSSLNWLSWPLIKAQRRLEQGCGGTRFYLFFPFPFPFLVRSPLPLSLSTSGTRSFELRDRCQVPSGKWTESRPTRAQQPMADGAREILAYQATRIKRTPSCRR